MGKFYMNIFIYAYVDIYMIVDFYKAFQPLLVFIILLHTSPSPPFFLSL